MADIFLSYASEDYARVRPIVARLEQEGWSVWWDHKIGAGVSFDRAIEQTLESARCVVVVWSRSAVDSDWVRAEAQEGLSRNILVPARIENVRPPLVFRAKQTIDLCTPTEEALDLVVDSVRQHLRGRAASTAAPFRGRRQATVLAARLGGYLSLSERLDPEDAEELDAQIREVARAICARYDGLLHRFFGEDLILLFGFPRAHEDDSLRGLRAATTLVREVGKAAARYGQSPPLELACVVVAGLIVVRESSDGGREPHIHGDPLVLASHLAGQSTPGCVLADVDTYRETRGYFTFRESSRTPVQGRSGPVDLYRLEAAKTTPVIVRGRGDVRSALVGRHAEMSELQAAMDLVREGRVALITIQGQAGTGKSRLIEAFRDQNSHSDIAWHEAYAVPHAQDTPYSMLIDFLDRAFDIRANDPPATVRGKLEDRLHRISGVDPAFVPWLGSLYDLNHAELENVEPKRWRQRLCDAVFGLLSGLARQRPTVFVLEDLHWADRATAELMRDVMQRFHQPALFLMTRRPGPLLGEDGPVGGARPHRQVVLGNLSPSETRSLAEGFLATDRLPPGLAGFLLSMVDGNPFYLEELLNTLADNGALAQRDGRWVLTRSLEDIVVPRSVQSLIEARMDTLSRAARSLIQEASVIGRTVPETLLRAITADPGAFQPSLEALLASGLLRREAYSGHAEFAFNHALTQEAVYTSMLRNDRRTTHERVASEIERMYQERLPELYGRLAFHYQRGSSTLKAVAYLAKAGDRSWRRCSLDEAHSYYREAYRVLTSPISESLDEQRLLIEVLNGWAIVHNLLGDYRCLSDLLVDHEQVARRVAADHPAAGAVFFGWLGFALQCQEALEPSYAYLSQALDLAEASGDPEVAAYVSAWMIRTCTDMGRLDEALVHARRGEDLAESLPTDSKLFRFIYSALGLTHYVRGDRDALDDLAQRLFEHGERNFDPRAQLLGYVNVGNSHLIAGEYDAAVSAYEQGIGVSVDPMHSMYARVMLGITHTAAGSLAQAEEVLGEVLAFHAAHGFGLLGTTARAMLSIVHLSKGELRTGTRLAVEVAEAYAARGNRWRHALHEHLVGRAHVALLLRGEPVHMDAPVDQVAPTPDDVRCAATSAEAHLRAAISIAREIGAQATLGQALLELGRLHQATASNELAYAALSEATQVLRQCRATCHLIDAQRALDQLSSPPTYSRCG